jgi:hypothetical protein
MTDLTGITITPGIMAPQLKDSLAETVNQIGAKMIDTVRIDTTHFVCTDPRGQAWEKAVEMNVPVVVPDWLKGCEREGRIVGVRGYYLDADPKLRQIGPTTTSSQQRGSVSSVVTRDGPRIEHTPPTPEQSRSGGEREGNTSTIEPPTPPPKPAGGASASTSTTSVNNAQALPSRGAKGLTQDESDLDSDKDDKDDEDDEDEDSDDASIVAAAAKAKAERPRQASKPDDDENFDEVAL